MKLHLQNDLATKTHPIMNRISLVLIGVLLSCVIFAILIEKLGETGLYIAVFIQILLVFGGFYYIEKRSLLRFITWGMAGAIVALFLIFILGVNLLPSSL